MENRTRDVKLTNGQLVIEENFSDADLAPLTIICHQGETDVTTAKGFQLTAELRDTQAQWSYQQRRFSTATAKYLPLFYPATWEQELNVSHPSKQTRQIVGMIELMAGALALARQQGKSVRILVEQPELYLHPSMQVIMTDCLVALMKEYQVTTP
jgi:hypothetical protein